MKKFALVWMLVLICISTLSCKSSFADTISFPMSYTSGPSLSQPQITYNYWGINYTFNNLLVLKNANTNQYSVYYFNLTSWWPKAVCASAGCPGTGKVNTRIDRWLYAYDFGSNPVVFSYPAVMFNTYRSFNLTEVIYATFPIYDSNGTNILRPSDLHQLKVTLDPQASGTVSGAGINCNAALGGLSDCTENYNLNQSVQLTASANSGYEFLYWDDGSMQSDVNPYVFTMSAGKNVTAKFVQVMSVNVTLNNTMGSVASSELPSPLIHCDNQTGAVCSKTYHWDDSVTLTASPNPGYKFTGWQENGQIISTEQSYCFLVESARSLTAVFEPFTMKLPLQGGKHWVLSVEAGGKLQCNGGTDPYHTDAHSSYYALDFVDYTSEDHDLNGVVNDVPILAAAGGVVSFKGGAPDDDSWGYTIVIDHGSNYKTRYAHLKYLPTVSGTVVQGQQIGVMGDTGNSHGTHLHFQTYHDEDSSSTNTFVGAIYLDGLKIDDYKVSTSTDCNAAAYLSTNQQ